MTWEWDETLYAGSAPHYTAGRMPYPPAVADALRAHLGLDGTGRLLDVGCGPGSLTLLLAPLFAETVGVDADLGMIAEARRRSSSVARHDSHAAVRRGSVEWHHLRAEELPAGLGTFRVVTFAQSFHWMDQPLVADRVRRMIAPGGAWVHVSATTHRGADGDDPLPRPRPPWDAIDALVAHHLGPRRRAGRSTLPWDETRSGEEDVMRAAGYAGPHRIPVTRGEVVDRSADEVVAAVHSLSYATPHLFGAGLDRFDAELRALLRAAAPDGVFSERLREMELVVWRPGALA